MIDWPTEIVQGSKHRLLGENGTEYIAGWYNGVWVSFWGNHSHEMTVKAGVKYLGPYAPEVTIPKTIYKDE